MMSIFCLGGLASARSWTQMYEGVVGVACCEEINLARELLKNSRIVIQAIPLIKNGCAHTSFNMETLRMIL